MLKILCLISFVAITGCNTIPDFPVVWFWSHQDLLDQEREIDSSFKKD